MQTIPVYCKNTNSLIYAPFGQKLYDFLQEHQLLPETPYLGALVNNNVHDLGYQIHKPSIIDFFDYYSSYGRPFYIRSLYLLLCKTVHDLLPVKVRLRIKHTISGGSFCTLENMDEPITEELVKKMFQHMKKIVQMNIPFERVEMLTDDAIEVLGELGMEDKYELLKTRNKIFTSVYRLDTTVNYYYGNLVPSTGYLQLFGLEKYENGILLKIPSAKNVKVLPKTHSNPKLFAQYQMSKDWAEKIGVVTVSDMNRIVKNGRALETILVAEAFQEKWIANVADQIHHRQGVKMVLISGPSSSGKTSTCRRLSVQLAVLGYKPVQISVDDFFVERDETPLDANGEKDFEALEAIDLPLFNDTLKRLVAGECVEIPTFDFAKGSKLWTGKTLQLEEDSIMVVEGIHCLNPKLTEQLPDDLKFKIFVSALTSISIDRQNPIPTTINRLIRRIVRDYNYRGYSALDTLKRWNSVRRGEEKNIFPYQENADVMINTSLIFELGLLKNYAIPILREVPETVPQYAAASSLLKFLSFFQPIYESDIPPTSILREFVGGSKFKY